MSLRISRSFSILLGVAALGFAMSSSTSFAKKDKGGDAAESAEAVVEALVIEDTGIEGIDKVFAPAKQMITNLTTAQTGLKAFNDGLTTAMGLPAGTPIADAVAELKKAAPGMLKVTMDGMKPKVEVKPEAPENVKKAVESINAGGEGIVATITAVKDMPEQIKATIDAAKGLPAAIPSMGIKATQIPKALKTVGKNAGTVGKIPGEAKKTSDAAMMSIDAIKTLGG
jgi:hypothetical protein